MVGEALKKIKNEMDKNKNDYTQVIGEFLLDQIKNHPEIAEKILDKSKSIAGSFGEMRRVAEKKKINNCGVLTPREGFDIVTKYFGIKAEETTILNSNREAARPVQPVAAEIATDSVFNVSSDDFF